MDPIQLLTDEPENPRRRKLAPPTDYSSRAVKIRLFSLVVGLMLLLVLMTEARKPERWAWMGFDEYGQLASAQSDEASAENSDDQERDFRERSTDPAGSQAGNLTDNSENPQQDGSGATGSREEVQKKQGLPLSLRFEQTFWQEVFAGLTTPEQKQLFSLLRSLKIGGAYSETERSEYLELLTSIDQAVNAGSLRALADAAKVDGEEAKIEATQAVVRITQEWGEKLLPYLRSSVTKDLDMLDIDPARIAMWESKFENAMLKIVQDRTEVLRVSDSPAWLVIWSWILEDSSRRHRPVTHYQLSSQPEIYRGEAVEVSGNLRLIEKVEMVKNVLGVKEYYILWIRGKEAGQTPLCVYALQLPPGAEEPTDRFTPVDWDIRVKGFFYKVRTYVNNKNEIAECPLILAGRPAVIARPIIAVSEDQLMSHSWIWWVIIGIMALSAAAAARIVYQSSKMKVYSPMRRGSASMGDELKNLESNSEILSTRDRIAELEKNDP